MFAQRGNDHWGGHGLKEVHASVCAVEKTQGPRHNGDILCEASLPGKQERTTGRIQKQCRSPEVRSLALWAKDEWHGKLSFNPNLTIGGSLGVSALSSQCQWFVSLQCLRNFIHAGLMKQ